MNGMNKTSSSTLKMFENYDNAAFEKALKCLNNKAALESFFKNTYATVEKKREFDDRFKAAVDSQMVLWAREVQLYKNKFHYGYLKKSGLYLLGFGACLLSRVAISTRNNEAEEYENYYTVADCTLLVSQLYMGLVCIGQGLKGFTYDSYAMNKLDNLSWARRFHTQVIQDIEESQKDI